MKLRIRLVIWLLLAITITGGFSWLVSTQATEKMTRASLEKRTAIIGQSIQSTYEVGQLVQAQDETGLQGLMKRFVTMDPQVDYVILTDGNQQVVGWAVNGNRAVELGISTPDERQTIASNYFSEDIDYSATMLEHSVSLLFEVLDKAQPSPEPVVDAEADATAIVPEQEAAPEPGRTRNVQANLFISYSPFAGHVFDDASNQIALLSMLPCLLLLGILLLTYSTSFTSRLDFLRLYSLGLAGGDLTQPFTERGSREFNEVGKAMNLVRRNFKKSIANAQGASREFENAARRVEESSGKITEDAIEQSHAIRQTVSTIEAMASSSTSVQNQIGEATRAVNDSTERLQGIRRSIENILGSMQMLSKSVDQTRRHLEGNISILGEVDRAVNQLQETATGTVTATAEIADNIRNVDSNTQTALRMSTEAATKAESGVEAFKESMAAIQRIRTNSDESANSIRFLSEKTESIEHILDVIDDISNRTRLLSLNASIIASHAGEAGRGFMIVADEIKDLASRTAGSTREIAKIINEVRDGSEGAIEVVERGVRAVNEGVKRAEFAGEVLSQIVASTNQTGNLVERISSAMNRQAAGTKQVSNAMREVHSVVVRVREVVGTQKNESRDLEASIRTMRIQMSRATATAKQQMSVIQEAIKAISFIFQQIQLISNFNTDQVRNQQSVSKAVDKLKHLSDLHHASADNLSMAVEQSNRQSKLVRDGLKSFRL
ncbi:MAG: hypothetical protein HOI23_19930 [Deltaproteobacteria bacterium]|jgi:methyl-accepting chemotaxis protein|nr:hypothetical protein [Deltaproteobacteria bacterium]MBT6431702.1 hypothetical protein [Deltaproteobacteria bacterium]MBT6492437.1 hypothetical protein [Deltaproteobacteria bacterium]